MRVHRALAQAGVASRRGAEMLIEEERVYVNGKRAVIGQIVMPTDRIEVDGKLVTAEPIQTYMLNKPIGMVSTASDPEGRPTVVDALPKDVRLYPVGRLDIDTTGILLITNDGDLAHRLMHPSSKVTKTYEAMVRGQVSAASVRQLRDGVELEDGMTQPAKVEIMDRKAVGATWVRIEITEGRNRLVRRMCDAIDHPVIKLMRTRYGGLNLGKLQRGEYRALASSEINRLEKLAGVTR